MAARAENQNESHFDFHGPVPMVLVVRTFALILLLLAFVAVVSLMVWTVVGWARSDRDRVERQERERDENGSEG
jgi:hypothetical protein